MTLSSYSSLIKHLGCTWSIYINIPNFRASEAPPSTIPLHVEVTLYRTNLVPARAFCTSMEMPKKWDIHQNSTQGVLKEVEAGETYKDPSIHYKEKVTCTGIPFMHEATLKPRNPRQVTNAQAQVCKSRKYAQIDLFNLVELTVDLKDYTHSSSG